jgi:hypothetical protein
VRDHVHHGGIVRSDLVAVIKLVFELLKKVVARPFLLHPVIVDRVLVRDHDKHFIANLDRIGHFVVVEVAVIEQTRFEIQFQRAIGGANSRRRPARRPLAG